MRLMISGVMLAATFFSPVALAAETPKNSQPANWMNQYRHELQSAWPKADATMQGLVKFVVGNEIWQPGRQFENGSNWLALACVPRGCVLEPAMLKVKKKSWQGHYDDKPTSGQHLSFRSDQASAARVVAWFQTTKAPAWLKTGTVATYYSGSGPLKRPSSKGTLEALIDLPGNDTATLVPMLWKTEEGASFHLQLRVQGKRQLLLGELGACSHEIDRKYLQWAGDLDGDGKADYLISFIDADGPVHLYLSSAAKAGQLVGLAGIYSSPPFGGECDGSGWL